MWRPCCRFQQVCEVCAYKSIPYLSGRDICMHTRALSDEDSVSVRYLIVKESLSKSRRCYVPHHTYSARLMSCGEGRNERLTFQSYSLDVDGRLNLSPYISVKFRGETVMWWVEDERCVHEGEAQRDVYEFLKFQTLFPPALVHSTLFIPNCFSFSFKYAPKLD